MSDTVPVTTARPGDLVKVTRRWWRGANPPDGVMLGLVMSVTPGKRGNGAWLKIDTDHGICKVYVKNHR